jgi:hypothetical protein
MFIDLSMQMGYCISIHNKGPSISSSRLLVNLRQETKVGKRNKVENNNIKIELYQM